MAHNYVEKVPEGREEKVATLRQLMDEVLTQAFDKRMGFVILVVPYDQPTGEPRTVTNMSNVDAKIAMRKMLRAVE